MRMVKHIALAIAIIVGSTTVVDFAAPTAYAQEKEKEKEKKKAAGAAICGLHDPMW